MTTYIDQAKGREHGMRPFVCRQGFHRWGPNTLWPGSTRAQVRWTRHCMRWDPEGDSAWVLEKGIGTQR